MATLIDSLTDLIAPATGQIAAKLGESEAAVAHGVTTTLGSVFGGLLNKTKDPAAFGQIIYEPVRYQYRTPSGGTQHFVYCHCLVH